MRYHTQHCSKYLNMLCHFGKALKRTRLARQGFYKKVFNLESCNDNTTSPILMKIGQTICHVNEWPNCNSSHIDWYFLFWQSNTWRRAYYQYYFSTLMPIDYVHIPFLDLTSALLLPFISSNTIWPFRATPGAVFVVAILLRPLWWYCTSECVIVGDVSERVTHGSAETTLSLM